MLRAVLIWLSEREGLFRLARRNGFARRLARRFVAGETIVDGLDAARALNAEGISASLDFLGEAVREPAVTRQARDTYLVTLDGIREAGLACNVSVKLTQMGLEIDEALCVENVEAVFARARGHGTFVRIDMEQSDFVAPTLRLFTQRFRPAFGDTTGVVLQSCLRRTARDVEDMIALGARVRLVKGAYLEPPDVAFPRKADVDANFVTCMERLLDAGNYPAIATHDEAIVRHGEAYARRRGIAPARYEFQMIYGVRRDLQTRLRREGYNVRVYIPFGDHWYPYFMRRLAERPANLAFILGNVVRESLRPR
jgi:proline dehydrogenase